MGVAVDGVCLDDAGRAIGVYGRDRSGAEEAFRRAVKARMDALSGLSGTFNPGAPPKL